MASAAILDLLGEPWDTHKDTLVVRTPYKNFVMIGSVVFKL